MPVLNRWLARFSFSLLILCGLLAWTAHKERVATGFGPRVGLLMLGAAASLAAGVAGVRARHRAIRDDFDRSAGGD